jgi:hypothetical protein
VYTLPNKGWKLLQSDETLAEPPLPIRDVKEVELGRGLRA